MQVFFLFAAGVGRHVTLIVISLSSAIIKTQTEIFLILKKRWGKTGGSGAREMDDRGRRRCLAHQIDWQFVSVDCKQRDTEESCQQTREFLLQIAELDLHASEILECIEVKGPVIETGTQFTLQKYI